MQHQPVLSAWLRYSVPDVKAPVFKEDFAFVLTEWTDIPAGKSRLWSLSNIHVERTGRNSRLVGWSIGPTSWSCDVPGCACGANASDANLGSVSGITLRDVTMDGPSTGLHGGPNFIRGFSENRQIASLSLSLPLPLSQSTFFFFCEVISSA